MGAQENVQLVKSGYAAFGRGDMPALMAMFADDIEWIIPGDGLPAAGTFQGHAGVAEFFQKLSSAVDIQAFEPREFIAESDKVVVIGWERAKVKATNRTAETHWVMVWTVRNGKIAKLQQYSDTLAWARAHEMTVGAKA